MVVVVVVVIAVLEEEKVACKLQYVEKIAKKKKSSIFKNFVTISKVNFPTLEYFWLLRRNLMLKVIKLVCYLFI